MHCRSRLSGYKVPKSWTLTAMLPVTPVGKVDKAAVKKLAEP
jgi:non-ribosomal peptide synthetase component E (peptide arylation enzyme)